MHRIPVIFILYGYLAPALLYLPGFWEIPNWLEQALLGFALPLWLLIMPWMDVLQSWHLTAEAAWFRVPTLTGFTLVLLAYTALYYVMVWLVRCLLMTQWFKQLRKAPMLLKAPILFIAYGYLSYLLLLIPATLPIWLDAVIVGFVLPLWLLMMPWMDLLQSWHLTAGEWMKAPHFVGLTLVLLAYTALYYAMLWLAWRLLQAFRRKS